MRMIDKDGRIPWPVVFAALDYGMQVFDNYNNGLRGYDMLFGEINFVSVILSALPVSKGTTIAQLGKTFAIETIKAGVEYTPNHKWEINDNTKEVLSTATVGTISDAVMGKVLEFGSESATMAAKNSSEKAAHQAILDANIAKNRPRSTTRASRAELSQGAAQAARADYLERKIVNETLGKAPALSKEVISRTTQSIFNYNNPSHDELKGYLFFPEFGGQ